MKITRSESFQQPDPFSGSPLRRVLIVDNMPQVRQDLRLLLQVTGELDIIGEAINGQDAICLVEMLHPDVVVMDLEMPEMDGCQAAQQIKAFDPGIKIIILTIHSGVNVEQRIRNSGADDYLQKGVSFKALMNAILSPISRTAK